MSLFCIIWEQNIINMRKRIIIIAIFEMLSLSIIGDEYKYEYTDDQTHIIYIYNPNSNTAEVKAGKTYIIGGNGEELSEEVEPGSPNVTGNIVIMENIEIDGHKYKVDRIGDYAFYLCTKLTKVVIPKTVSSMGVEAFAFTDLVSVVSYIDTPFDTDAFRYLNTSNITLYVPKGCVMKYKAVKGWSNFENIEEMGETDILSHKKMEQIGTRDYVFDLKGQRLSNPPRNAIYIKNGKKKRSSKEKL